MPNLIQTAASEWASFENQFMPECSAHERIRHRWAFYAGMTSMMSMICGMHEEKPEVFTTRMVAISQELERFCISLLIERAGGEQ